MAAFPRGGKALNIIFGGFFYTLHVLWHPPVAWRPPASGAWEICIACSLCRRLCNDCLSGVKAFCCRGDIGAGAEPCAGCRARSRRARRFPGKPAGLSAAPAPSGSPRHRSERAPIALNAVRGTLLKSCRAGGREYCLWKGFGVPFAVTRTGTWAWDAWLAGSGQWR